MIDDDGQPVEGAVVTGEWSGQAKGKNRATTDRNGVASTGNARAKGSGSVTFTVIDVAPVDGSGAVWDGVIRSASYQL